MEAFHLFNLLSINFSDCYLFSSLDDYSKNIYIIN